MANAKIEIYVDEASNEEHQPVTFPKTPMKMGSLARIPLTPAKRNNAMTPVRSGKLNVQAKQPVSMSNAKKDVTSEQSVPKLPDTEHPTRLACSLPKLISQIEPDQIEAPYGYSVTNDEIEQEIEFLSWNPVESACRLQKSLAQEIADTSLDSLVHPTFDDNELAFVLD